MPGVPLLDRKEFPQRLLRAGETQSSGAPVKRIQGQDGLGIIGYQDVSGLNLFTALILNQSVPVSVWSTKYFH